MERHRVNAHGWYGTIGRLLLKYVFLVDFLKNCFQREKKRVEIIFYFQTVKAVNSFQRSYNINPHTHNTHITMH